MKIILYMAVSLNGYIAKENNETPWSEEIWKSYYEIAKKFKAIIIGRKTYEIMKQANEFEKIGNPLTVVVTSSNLKDKIVTTANSPKEALKIIKEKNFKEALIAGGGKLNSSFIKENLIDEIILDIEPLIFGKGIELFSDENFEKRLKLLNITKLSNNIIHLRYKITAQGGTRACHELS